MDCTLSEIESILEGLKKNVFYHQDEIWLCVLSQYQRLYVIKNEHVIQSYAVSTAKNGLGCEQESYKTPTGLHFIIDKIGEKSPINTIFIGRKATENHAEIITLANASGKDLITSRILRLSGLETQINHGKAVDSYQRYIYIHGTNEEGLIGKAVSHGCIRMKNKEVIELYNKISPQTLVYIR